MNPNDRRYSREHEWAQPTEDAAIVRVGITHFAQDSLGDIVFVSLPETGAAVEQFAKMGEVESVKAVSELFSPVSGTVVEVNADLGQQPELLNQDPFATGWMITVRLSDPSEMDKLLTAEAYDAFLQEESH